MDRGAFALYLVMMIVTIAVNVPMNDALKAAGDPATIFMSPLPWAAFDERSGRRSTWSGSCSARSPSACSAGPST